MNIGTLFSKVNRRLSNIERFNNTPRIHKESVAEHSYFVSFYVMVLSEMIPDIDVEKSIKLALLHDIEEIISGDLPHTVKLKYPEFNDTLEKMNLLIVKEIFNDNKYIDLWKEVRLLNTKESKLVHLADMISVLLYTRDEIKMGNEFMEEIYNKERKYIGEFIEKYPEFKFVDKLGILE